MGIVDRKFHILIFAQDFEFFHYTLYLNVLKVDNTNESPKIGEWF